MRDADNDHTLTWREIRNFQVSKAARCLEIQLMMRKDGMSKSEAVAAVDKKSMEDLDVLADINAFLEEVKVSRTNISRSMQAV